MDDWAMHEREKFGSAWHAAVCRMSRSMRV